MAAPNYFTCTLGQASSLHLSDPSFRNIIAFVDSQAKSAPSAPAVGFAVPNDTQSWDKSIYTFSDISRSSLALAAQLRQDHGETLEREKTVALICPSTPEFLFTWLALMRLGHAVLLIAPQCQPAAIAHLCKTCGTGVLFYDHVYAEQALEAEKVAKCDDSPLRAVALPFTTNQSLSTLLSQQHGEMVEAPQMHENDVAYLHHTSGTSSGLPKPIPQTHRAGAGVLPSFPDGHKRATFTTTPLYHGGIADLLRAWTSGALIWLFPGKGVPITAGNIVKCLDVAESCHQRHELPPVKYFSSVPYVLQMMEADRHGLQYLQGMDIVGVGGAALPVEVGDRLVENRVNLISRFGSAECGFLMSSHRKYAEDKEWQYLRSDSGAQRLTFEEQGDGLAELVIMPGWPHMAKKNRENESFATADLFAPHPSIASAWRYHSRADSQLTLITGKKFDPAPLEGAIAALEVLGDVLIFGNGQPFPGALLFRAESARSLSNHDLLERIWPMVEKLNCESQDHARLPRKMLVPMPVLEKPLEKSSKGTIIRAVAEDRFDADIDNAYLNMSAADIGDVPDDEVLNVLTNLIKSMVPKKAILDPDTDLFSFGVDSVAGIQIRYGLRQLLPQTTTRLPLNIVEDCGTAARLAEYVVKQRHGQEFVQHDDDEHRLMLELVDKYSNFEPRGPASLATGDLEQAKQTDVVVLTGATGALGAHLLDMYRQRELVTKVYCLVRGNDLQASKERVNQALEQRGLRSLSDDTSKAEIVILQAKLGETKLGLSDEVYGQIAREATIIMHVAWSVNFRMRLQSFEADNIASLNSLINLALKSPRPRLPAFGFCSSVASVMALRRALIPEEIVDEPSAASALGYSRSKWVAEQICARAARLTPLRGRIAIFRVGQLSGGSQRGVWNTKEAWPMMLSAVKLTQTLPALDGQVLDWLPVDVCAAALVQGIDRVGTSGVYPDVLHVLNYNSDPEWANLLGWLGKRLDFKVVSPQAWVGQLEQAEAAQSDHPALRLLDHWRRAYSGNETDKQDEGGSPTTRPAFDMEKTKRLVPALRAVSRVDEQYFLKIWSWIDRNM